MTEKSNQSQSAQPVAQEASGWVAQMQSAKADPNGRKVIWHRSKFVRTKHDAQMIVAQWREQMPSEVLEYTIAEVCTFAPGVRLEDTRTCTCHPSERPAVCQRKYALSECLALAKK